MLAMKNVLLATVALTLCAAAMFAFERWKTGSLMTEAARNFLASLTPEQKAKVSFSYDDAERKNWHFIPRTRKGLPFKELAPEQDRLAHAFLSTGLGRRAYMQANTIMSLDAILKELEKGMANTPRRDVELYYFSIFGDPSPLGRWGWRVEGHHLSVNFVIDKGQVVASTPAFIGANPAEVREGPRKGLRTLPEEEDIARQLLLALDDKQRARATILEKAPGDILATPDKRAADIGNPAGLPYSAMSAPQRELLNQLLEVYVSRMPDDLALARWDELRKSGIEKVFFAWAGGSNRGDPHYYRLQGPTFLVEYDDTQNNANHIHTVWRDLHGDFGPDLLAEHYRQFRHVNGKHIPRKDGE